MGSPKRSQSLVRKQVVVAKSLKHGKDTLIELFGGDVDSAVEAVGYDRAMARPRHGTTRRAEMG